MGGRAWWLVQSSVLALALSCAGKVTVDNSASVMGGMGGALSAAHAGAPSSVTSSGSTSANSGAGGGAGAAGSPTVGSPGGGVAGAEADGGVVSPPSDDTPPLFNGVQSVDADTTQVTLHWDPASDDTTKPAGIVYLVYESLAPFSTDPEQALGAPVAISAPGATSISVAVLMSNTLYHWLVRAEDAAHNEDQNVVQIAAATLISFEGDVQPIFTASCALAGCHGSSAPMQHLDLSEGNAYANLYDVPAFWITTVSPYWGCTQLLRVQPMAPEQSFLMAKLDNVGLSASSGCTCPSCRNVLDPTVPDTGWNLGLGQPYQLCERDPSCPGLPQAERTLISDWITQGALDN